MLQSLLARLRGANDDEKGFTLIELLVVVLIIGILAAIALPTFLGQQDKAKDSSAKSNARNAVTQMESCLADGSATVSSCRTATDVNQFKNTDVTANGTNGYVVTATSESANKFLITKSDSSPGSFTRSCTTTGNGACPADGKW